jgi:hypothetical protein
MNDIDSMRKAKAASAAQDHGAYRKDRKQRPQKIIWIRRNPLKSPDSDE